MVANGFSKTVAVALCLVMLSSQLTAFTEEDCKLGLAHLRDIYELLIRTNVLPPNFRYNHEMVRKGGRTPSLRLRFGRRSDPSWEGMDTPQQSPPDLID